MLFELDNDNDEDDDEDDDDDDDDDDSCFAIFVARQDGVTNIKAPLWKFPLSLFLALTLHPNTHRITPHHVSPEAKSPSIALMSTWYIVAGQVFFRPYVLRYIRLQSLVVNFHLALIQFKIFPRFVSMPGRKQMQIWTSDMQKKERNPLVWLHWWVLSRFQEVWRYWATTYSQNIFVRKNQNSSVFIYFLYYEY